MHSFKKILSTVFLSFILLIPSQEVKSQTTGKTYDLVIYGGTSAGIAAAIQSSRMGKSVVVLEPSGRIG